MNKFFVIAFAFAFVASVSAISGVKDWAGNYYDLTTGQYSSSLTGRVYNTAPTVVASAPYVSAPLSAHLATPYGAPLVASYAAPLSTYGAYSYAAPYPLAYSSRLLLK
ncbi:uncharacterized protein LOC128962563 [Oppia nitens]|uniref:uncharacterized protein LOC128962563 n=1 Tax=Oppia nitens TaxID=1686743 RepID=UPI0023DADB0D|nr:uncharacterized protein LOC128962563 [Oppia nitens]